MNVQNTSLRPLGLSLVLAALMGAVAVSVPAVHELLRPIGKSTVPKMALEKLIPAEFGAWRVVEDSRLQVVNPQAQQLLDKIYSQTLTRTYTTAEGYLIMLSIAYGDEQRVGLNVHLPEVCYPAQGFRIIEPTATAAISTADGPINVKRMEAQMGARVEPVTYWLLFGDQIVDGSSRLPIKIRFALDGKVPDGLLFRVSSIDSQREHAFRQQERFVAELLAAVGPTGRAHLAGSPRR